MGTGGWAVVFSAVVAVLGAVWIGNTIRWTRANGTLGRRSARVVGPQDKAMDGGNHRTTDATAARTRSGRHGLVLVVGIVVTALAVVALVWSILYAVAG